MTELTEALSIFQAAFLGLIVMTTAVAARNLRIMNQNTSSWKHDDLMAIKYAVESTPMISHTQEPKKEDKQVHEPGILIADFERRLEEILK